MLLFHIKCFYLIFKHQDILLGVFSGTSVSINTNYPENDYGFYFCDSEYRPTFDPQTRKGTSQCNMITCW